MPLHLNLYHEIHYQAHQRARDPFKLATFAGIGLAVLLAGYYFFRVASVSGLEKEAAAIQGQWKELEPKKAEAIARFAELVRLEKVNEALNQRIQGRLYFAPILTLVAQSVPEHIQIQQMSVQYSSSAQTLTLTFTGLAAADQARGAAEQFRRGLKEAFSKAYTKVSAEFDANSLEETRQTVTLNGQELPTASFRIRLEMGLPEAPVEP